MLCQGTWAACWLKCEKREAVKGRKGGHCQMGDPQSTEVQPVSKHTLHTRMARGSPTQVALLIIRFALCSMVL